MQYAKWCALVLCVLLLGGCALSSQPIAALPTVSYTYTLVPSVTPTERPTEKPTPHPETPTPAITYVWIRTPTDTPTSVPTPTSIPTLWPSPTPPAFPSIPIGPLSSHRWNPESVLVKFEVGQGDGGYHSGTYTPLFILYADGRLIVNSWKYDSVLRESHTQLLGQNLERQKLCALLNTIEQTEFLDYDPTTYRITDNNSPLMGGATQIIQVNAWRSKYVAHYALSNFMRPQPVIWDPQSCRFPCVPPPEIAPSLRAVYELLMYLSRGYKPADMHLYKYDKLAVWIDTSPEMIDDRDGTPWPLQSPSLASLYSQSSCREGGSKDSVLVLSGAVAETVYSTLDFSMITPVRVYTEGGQKYWMLARPLLPYEAPPSCGGVPYPIPAPGIPKPSITLECKPSDGLFEPPGN